MTEGQKRFYEFGYPDERFETVVSDNLHCAICSCVLKEPVMCKNEHCFCRGCITKHLENYHTCPSCNQDLTVESLAEAPRIVRNLLSEQKIRCDHDERGCQEIVQLGNLARHVAVCGKAPVVCANEECSSEINREDLVRHESEECRFRKVKCRSCKEMGSMVQDIGAELRGLSKHVNKLDASVHEQSTEVKTGFTAMENRLEEVESKFQEIENKFDEMESKFDNRFGEMENRFGEMENRFGKMENKFEKMQSRFEENQFLNVEGPTSREQQSKAMVDDRESARSNQATSLDPSSDFKDAKNPNECAYVVAGGYGKEGKALDSVEIYDKTSNSWIKLQPMKTCRGMASSIVYNGQVLVTGGRCNDNVLSSIEQYSRHANPFVPPSWCNFPVNLPQPLQDHRTVLYNDRVLVLGGKDNLDMIYEIQLDFPFITKVLAKLPSPIPATGCGVVLVNDKILIFGGRASKSWDSLPTADVSMYDITKNEFQELAQLPYPVYNMATVRYEKTVILIGGEDFSSSETKKRVVSYNVETQKSSMLPPMKQGHTQCCAVVDGNSLVVMGGQGRDGFATNSVEAFDFKTSKWRKLS